MNELAGNLSEIITKQLNTHHFELLDIVPLPTHSDKLTRLRTLEEALDDLLDSSNEDGTFEFLIQVKRCKRPKQTDTTSSEDSTAKKALETIYLPNGKLNVPYLIKNGDLLFEEGDYGLAKNIFKAILSSGDYSGTALLRLGKCLEAENKLDEAKTSYESSITFHPTFEAYKRLASILSRQNQDHHAADTLERALNLKDLTHDTRFEILKACGNSWTRAKRFEDAERCFKKALEIKPSADDVRSNLGALYLQSTKISEAKRNFIDAIASNPRNHHALSGLGSCYMAEGDKKSAHDYFCQALAIDLNNPSAIFYLVKCAYEIRSYAPAAKILQEYIQSAPTNPDLLYSLGGLQYHLGRMADSKESVLKALELQPQHEGAKELLGMIERYSEGP